MMTFWPMDEEKNLESQLIRFAMINDERLIVKKSRLIRRKNS
jgi:hypothetical protein